VKIEVKLFATFAFYLPETSAGSATLEVTTQSTVRQVVTLLGVPDEMPAIILVNGRDADPEQVLEDGDVVAMFPPLAGGRQPAGGGC